VAALVSFENVSVRYISGPAWARRHTDALRDVSLQVEAGQTLGIVGESGSGKSTLAGLSLGLLQPSHGRVLFDGKPLTRRARRSLRGRMQVVLQNPEWSLNPRLRCGTSVGEPLAIQGQAGRVERAKRVAETLEQVGLGAAIARRFPHELSGGQQQRVGIARALVTSPSFIVFDEAVSALDASTQTQILNLVRSLQETRKFTALFISHDLAAVRYVCDAIAVMYAGRVMELAEAEVFYERTSHPYSRALQAASLDTSEGIELAESLEVDVEGCPLAPRCPFAIDRCRTELPALRHVRRSWTACHRAEEMDALVAGTGADRGPRAAESTR
jgi:oligopeptide/dipeptide ABC transporter ATP-binding protein